MGSSSQVILYGMWASPAVRRIEWALKLKGIEYEYVEEDLSNKSISLLMYNPISRQVPVLVHDGRPVIESLVILEYIDEVWKGNPLLPKDPYDRAMARFWANFVDGKCREASKVVFFAEGEERAEAMEKLEEVIGTLEEVLKGRKFFGGESIGYLDLAAGWMTFWMGITEEVASCKILDAKKFPSFVSWAENFLQVQVIKENLPPRDETVEFFANFRRIQLAAAPK